MVATEMGVWLSHAPGKLCKVDKNFREIINSLDFFKKYATFIQTNKTSKLLLK